MAAGKRKRYALYGIFFVFIFLVLFLGQKFPRNQDVVQYVIEVSAPVLKAFRQPLIFAEQTGGMFTDYLFVVEKNKQLRDEVKVLRKWHHEALYLRRENQDLQTLLDMANQFTTNPIAGRILADTRSPYARTVLIDVGRKNNVQKGQAVLGASGLVGRILEVSESTSRVLLLGDFNARIPVKLLDSGVVAIARGGRYRALDLLLSDGPLNALEGELVVTSGLGGIFASGLPVGVIVKTGDTYKVQPHTDFSKLDKVVVHRRPVYGVVTEGLDAENEENYE